MPFYALNRPRIVDENVDGEYILIDTQTGLYFSMDGQAAWIWQQIRHGVNTDAILKTIKDHGSPDEAEKQLHQAEIFISELLREELIIAVAQSTPAEDSIKDTALGFKPGNAVLKKFDDMQEYLLADPIHDIGPEGWPNPPADS